MSAFQPRIVVSLPARTVRDARHEVEAARAAGAHLAEVRFDRWLPSERERAAELFPSPLPLVATLRSREEGGEGPDEPAARKEILTALSSNPFAYLDLEGARDRSLEGTLGAHAPRFVRSCHLPESVSEHDLEVRLREAAPSEGLVKVVLPATFSRVVRELLPRWEDSLSPRPVLLTTGPSGSVWRAWSGSLGVPWVFASLPEESGSGSVEPSQIPADRLATYFAAPEAPLFAVIGHPVAHSWSPAIHHRWMRRTGRNGLYVTLDLANPDEVRLAVEILPTRSVRGVNVTHPWKRLAFEAAGGRSADALATGVANCLTFRDGRVEADNTDLGAVRRRLEELKESGRWDGTNLTILGGGGAARATLAAAREIGGAATILTRRRSESDALASEFDAKAGDPATPAPSSLVVHATDFGRPDSGELELPIRAVLAPRGYLLDWVYAPAVATLSQIAREVGAGYEDGRRLLVYQAAASFLQWWGEAPDAKTVEDTLREVGCAA